MLPLSKIFNSEAFGAAGSAPDATGRFVLVLLYFFDAHTKQFCVQFFFIDKLLADIRYQI
jgi:hypothetical protein